MLSQKKTNCWADVQAIDVKFSQELTHQKSLKSIDFWQSYLQNKKIDVFGGHSICSSFVTMQSIFAVQSVMFTTALLCVCLFICLYDMYFVLKQCIY